jgi:hypothetical protein
MKNLIKCAFLVCLGLAPTTNNLFAQTNTNVGNSSGNGGTGTDNSFYGYASGPSNSSGSNNTFIGAESGFSNTTGNKNAFLGWYSGFATTTGYNNVFVGSKTGKDNTTGYRNTFLGPGAGLSNTSGYQNTLIGYLAGRNNQIGTQNVFLGSHAGFNNVGSYNVFIGNQAGYYETGSDKLYIDNSSTSTPLIYGDFAIDQVKVNGDLQVTDNVSASALGLIGQGGINFELFSESITGCNETRWHFGLHRICGVGPLPPQFKAMTLRYAGDNFRLGIGVTNPQEKLEVNGKVRAMDYLTFSDKRLKQDIESIGNASDILSKLEGVTYSFRDELREEGKELPKGQQIGFIAQDLQKVLPEVVSEDEEGLLSVSYRSLIPILVEGHKELMDENERLETSLKEAQEMNRKMEQEIEDIKSMLADLTEKLPTTSVQLKDANEAMLLQNAPNPFRESTTIEYNLPANCEGAQLLITDSNGSVLQSVKNLETGRGKIVLQANSLTPGKYRYTLVCQGQTLESKSMVIIR